MRSNIESNIWRALLSAALTLLLLAGLSLPAFAEDPVPEDGPAPAVSEGTRKGPADALVRVVTFADFQ